MKVKFTSVLFGIVNPSSILMWSYCTCESAFDSRSILLHTILNCTLRELVIVVVLHRGYTVYSMYFVKHIPYRQIFQLIYVDVYEIWTYILFHWQFFNVELLLWNLLKIWISCKGRNTSIVDRYGPKRNARSKFRWRSPIRIFYEICSGHLKQVYVNLRPEVLTDYSLHVLHQADSLALQCCPLQQHCGSNFRLSFRWSPR
jgi:hypothetical protein